VTSKVVRVQVPPRVQKLTNMKKLAIVLLSAVSLAACHYGENEAKQTLQRNEEYKSEKTDYSINKAGEYGKQNGVATATPDSTKTDSTSK
jgi:hypothetical protein